MPRTERIHTRGGKYHVMIRGNFSNKIFLSDQDRHIFIKLLKQSTQQYGARAHLFCLMSNHVHLVIEVADVPLAKIMQTLNSQYAKYFIGKQTRPGQLFQGRYECKIIGDEVYLLELCHYIHMNPVKAGIVNNIDDYPWSSHSQYLGFRFYSWVDTVLIHGLICSITEENGVGYKEYIYDREKYFPPIRYCNFDEKGLLLVPQTQREMKTTDDSRICYPLSIEEIAILILETSSHCVKDIKSRSRKRSLLVVRSLIAYFAHYFGHHQLQAIATYLHITRDALSRVMRLQFDRGELQPYFTKIHAALKDACRRRH